MLGRHDGITNFTVGQRKGLSLSGNAEPLFVLKLDPANARVVVGPRSALGSSTIALKDVNWLAPPRRPVRSARQGALHAPAGGGAGDAAGRRRGAGGTGRAGRGIAPGQACVFYQGSRVLGGGWIAAAEPAKIDAVGAVASGG